jgi:hypothetical protein
MTTGGIGRNDSGGVMTMGGEKTAGRIEMTMGEGRDSSGGEKTVGHEMTREHEITTGEGEGTNKRP